MYFACVHCVWGGGGGGGVFSRGTQQQSLIPRPGETFIQTWEPFTGTTQNPVLGKWGSGLPGPRVDTATKH